MEKENLHAPLSPRQNAFVIAYCKKPNPGQAAIAAGYSSAAYGYELIRRAAIRALILEQRDIALTKFGMDQGPYWAKISEVALGEQVVTETDSGQLVVTGPRPSDNIKAAAYILDALRDSESAGSQDDEVARYIIRVPSNGRGPGE